MRKEMVSRTLILILLALGLSPIAGVTAGPRDSIDSERIDLGESYFHPFSLKEGEGIFGEFRILYGEQVYFFIVDENGHEDIQSFREASTGYLENTYERKNGTWHEWRFIAPHESTWYVYFSKAWLAPVSAETVCIEGFIERDTEAPFVIFEIPAGNLTGVVTLRVTAIDNGFPIKGTSIYVDGNLDSSYSFEEDSKSWEFNLNWDTSGYENGEHLLEVRVWDDVDNVGSYQQVVFIKHSEFNPAIFLFPIVGLIGLLCIFFSRSG